MVTPHRARCAAPIGGHGEPGWSPTRYPGGADRNFRSPFLSSSVSPRCRVLSVRALPCPPREAVSAATRTSFVRSTAQKNTSPPHTDCRLSISVNTQEVKQARLVPGDLLEIDRELERHDMSPRRSTGGLRLGAYSRLSPWCWSNCWAILCCYCNSYGV